MVEQFFHEKYKHISKCTLYIIFCSNVNLEQTRVTQTDWLTIKLIWVHEESSYRRRRLTAFRNSCYGLTTPAGQAFTRAHYPALSVPDVRRYREFPIIYRPLLLHLYFDYEQYLRSIDSLMRQCNECTCNCTSKNKEATNLKRTRNVYKEF